MSASRWICVVDDDEAVRDSLKTLLELQNYCVHTFETCEEFLAAEAAGAFCLVLDIHLPGMNGFELMDVMKRENFQLPTILITARGDKSIQERANALGAVALLDKPIEFSNLMSAIMRCIEVRLH